MLITKENLVSEAQRFYDYFQKGVKPYHNLVLLEMSAWSDSIRAIFAALG